LSFNTSLNKTILLSCSRDKTIRGWDEEETEELFCLKWSQDEINHIQCDNYGILSITDKNIKYWSFTPDNDLIDIKKFNNFNIKYVKKFEKEEKKKITKNKEKEYKEMKFKKKNLKNKFEKRNNF
jgi:WD40 repeat protein